MTSAAARRLAGLFVLIALVLAGAACGGRAEGDSVVRIEGPSFEPQRIAIRTLEPGRPPTPVPTPEPTPSPTPAPQEPEVQAPRGASMRSEAGSQEGAPGSYCWSSQRGGPARCVTNPTPSQPSRLEVRQGEAVLIAIDADLPPSQESVRPFQGSRSGYSDQPVDPALETELTIDLPPGEWSLDLCATWAGRGQPICWLFELDVV